MTDFLRFVDVYGHLVTVSSWLISAIMLALLVYPVYEKWRYQKQFRKHLRLAARAQARLAVFDSWVRSGGRKSQLNVDVERDLRNDYAAAARKGGPEFFSDYEAAEVEADMELNGLMRFLNLTDAEEAEDNAEES